MVRQAPFQGSIYFLLVLLLQACSGSDDPDMKMFNSATVNVQIENGVPMKNNKPFTGIIYTLQANCKDTAEIVCFNQGREHGVWKKFYPDGGLMEQRYFSNGKKAGVFNAWWPNGAKKLEYHFEDGEYNGTCKEWTANRLLVKEMNYNKGYEEGRQKQFYEDGKIKANYIITGGRRYGLLGTKNCENVADSVFKN